MIYLAQGYKRTIFRLVETDAERYNVERFLEQVHRHEEPAFVVDELPEEFLGRIKEFVQRLHEAPMQRHYLGEFRVLPLTRREVGRIEALLDEFWREQLGETR